MVFLVTVHLVHRYRHRQQSGKGMCRGIVFKCYGEAATAYTDCNVSVHFVFSFIIFMISIAIPAIVISVSGIVVVARFFEIRNGSHRIFCYRFIVRTASSQYGCGCHKQQDHNNNTSVHILFYFKIYNSDPLL